jgi:hypothetical protein
LSGISFAVANVTGFVARALDGNASANDLEKLLAAKR